MSLETYSKATQSKNLAWHDFAEMPIDWIAAAGLVSDRLASALARFMATQDGYAFWPVVEAIEAQYGRRIERQAQRDIEAALWWWLAPACVTCHGNGHISPEDAPKVICPDCSGTAKTPHKSKSRVYVDALQRIDAAAGICYNAIAKRVA